MAENTQNRALYIKVFIIFALLVGLVTNLFLIQTIAMLNTSAAVSTVRFSFSPGSATIPPSTNFILMLDPNGQEISFVQAQIHFDPEVLQLTSNIVLGSELAPPPEAAISYTLKDTANSTGIIDIVLVQKQGTSTTTTPFEIATLPFAYVGAEGSELTDTDLTVVDESTQVVNSSSEDLPVISDYASITLSPAKTTKTAKTALASIKSAVAVKVLNNFKGSCPDRHIDTAIGCIPYTDTAAIAKFFLVWGIGFAGGIALILIVYASYMIMASRGDPKKLEAGKELLTAAVAGLILIVFSPFILKVIGVDILGIAGF